MIYTTYFGKLNSRDFDKTKFTPIAICAKPPEGWAGKCLAALHRIMISLCSTRKMANSQHLVSITMLKLLQS